MTEEGAASPGQTASGSWKRPRNGFSPAPPERDAALRPLWSPEPKGNKCCFKPLSLWHCYSSECRHHNRR